jgi:hypothetical protein
MKMGSGSSFRWWIIVAALVIGSISGLYLQRFPLTEPFFKDILSTGFDLKDVHLGFADLGLKLYLRWNLGTLIGAVVGLWAAR